MRDDIPLAVKELTGVPAGQTEITEPRWDIYYAVVFAVCAAIVEEGSLGTVGRVMATAALAAMVPWYLLIGRAELMRDGAPWDQERATWRGWVYLTGLVALFAVVQSQNPNAWFLAFALSPQCFQMTTPRRAMAFVAASNGAAALLVIVRGHGRENAVAAVGVAVFAVTFSYVYSRFMMRVIVQNIEHAALIEELSSTRHELAAVHHEAGVLAERHRLAGEIHDTLAQGFTSIVALVQAAQAGVDPEASEVRRHLDMALDTARDNLAEARALVTALSPARLESSSLGDALRRVAQTTGAEAGLAASTEVTGPVRALRTGTEVVLLRVCQEALANVRKHAGARQVSVCLCYSGAQVELTISDDGAGFDVTMVNGGYGLRGMRDRVRQVGGTVTVHAEPGAGTRVRAVVPG